MIFPLKQNILYCNCKALEIAKQAVQPFHLIINNYKYGMLPTIVCGFCFLIKKKILKWFSPTNLAILNMPFYRTNT